MESSPISPYIMDLTSVLMTYAAVCRNRCYACTIEYRCTSGALVLQENSELTELFDLESSEELLERFACALLQTYSCSHNGFTPEQQVAHCLLFS